MGECVRCAEWRESVHIALLRKASCRCSSDGERDRKMERRFESCHRHYYLQGAVSMPKKPKRPCAHQGCPALTDGMYCDEHKPLHKEYTRSASARGYNSKWRRESKRYLSAHPLCVMCAKKDPPQYINATVVDHIVPHRGNQLLFWDTNNWQSLCKECHDTKTLTEDINPVYSY